MSDTESIPAATTGACLTERISVGVLTRLVSRELVDEVVSAAGKREQRVRLLPARLVVYFVMALALFYDDAYEEVMRKLVQNLRPMGIWKKDWRVPTTGGLVQARKRLGAEVMRELFNRVAVPCARRSTQGAWLRGRRLMSVDGFDVDAADTSDNAAHFGYSGGKKKEKGAFPKVPVVALAECGTHAIVGAEIGTQDDGEYTLAARLLATGVVQPGMLIMFDRGIYGYELLSLIVNAGADAVFRMKANVNLPVIKWFHDGSYLSFVAEPEAKSKAAARLRSGKIALTELPGMYVRVVDYEVPNRNGKNELFTLLTNIIDPAEITAIELAAAYHERWEIELAFDEIETHQRGPAVILRSKTPEMVEQELWGLLLTHYGIRQIMAEAADQAELDPDRLSFMRSLRTIRRQVTSQAAFSP